MFLRPSLHPQRKLACARISFKHAACYRGREEFGFHACRLRHPSPRWITQPVTVAKASFVSSAPAQPHRHRSSSPPVLSERVGLVNYVAHSCTKSVQTSRPSFAFPFRQVSSHSPGGNCDTSSTVMPTEEVAQCKGSVGNAGDSSKQLDAAALDPESDVDVPVEAEELQEALSRPPPVNSSYLPLPWKGRLGYVSDSDAVTEMSDLISHVAFLRLA